MIAIVPSNYFLCFERLNRGSGFVGACVTVFLTLGSEAGGFRLTITKWILPTLGSADNRSQLESL